MGETSATSESLKQDIETLTQKQIQKVAEFISFLRFQEKRQKVKLTPELLAPLATEFLEEDRAITESGMDDYVGMLSNKDKL
ncbi:MAG: hypothetical protein AAFY78_07505 [Cyanobacteria bacterium J06648_16]